MEGIEAVTRPWVAKPRPRRFKKSLGFCPLIRRPKEFNQWD